MKQYTYDEVLLASLEYFNNDLLAATTWINKYAKRDKDNNLVELTPDDMHKRLAKAFFDIEKNYINNDKSNNDFSEYYKCRKDLTEDSIYLLFKNFKKVIPAGSVMSGLGSDKPVSLSNCFVLPSPEDSYSSIMLTRLKQVELMKRRGGVGYDLSNLRPRDAEVHNAAVTSTGAASFMSVCSDVTNEVAQQGRRGALMLSLDIRSCDIKEFIEKKQDLTKVTGANVSVQVTDDFMNAVKNNEDYFLRWPVDSCINFYLTEKANGIKTENLEYDKLYKMVYTDNEFTSVAKQGYMKKVKAKELWDTLIHCAWNTAEPGILFKDRHLNFSPDGIYDKYKGISTNPCITGDTKIAVADGRGYVTIKELAEIGDDVDVYCINDKGHLDISKMINPRISGYNKDIFEITLENGHKIKCTDNHKILTNNKGYVLAKDLLIGDSLVIMTKTEMNWDERYHKRAGKNQPYNFMLLSGSNKINTEHAMIYKYNNPNQLFEVVHHKDYNGLNNNINNLLGMTAKDHINLHKQNMYGDKNPMVKISKDPILKAQYSTVMSAATLGEKNGNCKIKLDEYKQNAINFAKSLNRNFYLKEWLNYCKLHNYPIIWDRFLIRSFGQSKDFIKMIAKEANVPYITANGKLMQKYLKAINNGYNVYINSDETDVLIDKVCEECGKHFTISWDTREHSFCSAKCVNKWQAKYSEKYITAIKKAGDKKAKKYLEKNKQLINFYKLNKHIINFSKLKQLFTKTTNIKYDSRAKYAYKTYDELKLAVNNYNHKIIDIQYIGKDTVYNGTVEKYHNYFSGEFIETNEWNRKKTISINQKNCGEIFMSGGESCRLLCINMLSFIDNPYTNKATINTDKVYSLTYESMRLADDLVDLELNAVSKIMDIVKNDTYAYDLWKLIFDKGKDGRRVGLEFTALSDMVAALNINFCSEKGNKTVEQVCKLMQSACLDCQVDMAIERGAFNDLDLDIEKHFDNDWYQFIKNNYPYRYEHMMKYGRRNISYTTVGPCGSISIMTQTSSGIEPLFMPYYVRRRKCMNKNDRVDFTDNLGVNFTEFVVVHPQLKNWAILNISDYTDFENLTIKDWEKIYKQSPWFNSCAPDINWEKRVELQAIVLKNLISHSISSCITADTLIETDNGYYYLDEIFNINSINEGEFKKNTTFVNKVKSHDNTYNNIKSFYNNGKKDVFTLTLLNDLYITCTSNEKFLVFDEDNDTFSWKELSQILEGDKIKL